MKLIEEQVKKLAEGEATLRADHDKPEQMEEVMRATKWDLSSSDWDDYKFIYLFKTGGNLFTWNATDSEEIIKNKVLNLSDFYESEEETELKDIIKKLEKDLEKWKRIKGLEYKMGVYRAIEIIEDKIKVIQFNETREPLTEDRCNCNQCKNDY